jgi:hypothetical protein
LPIRPPPDKVIPPVAEVPNKYLDAVSLAVAKKNPDEVEKAVGELLDKAKLPSDVEQSLRGLPDQVRDLCQVEAEIAGIEAGGLRKPPSLPVPAPPGGTRPGQLEKPTEGLPPLTGDPVKDLPAAVGVATRSSCGGLRAHTDKSWERMRAQLTLLKIHKRDSDEQDRDGLAPGQWFPAVEKHLNRPLSSAERQMVPTMLRQGRTPEEIARILGRP